MENVIVLNADMSYHQTVNWQDAVCMLLKGVAEPVVEGTKVIRSVSLEIIVPKILKLIKYVSRNRHNEKFPFKKRVVFMRDGHTCQYCGKKLHRDDCTLDHVTPKVRGGKSTYTNCVTACMPCNLKKGDKMDMKPIVKPKDISLHNYVSMRSNDALKLLNDIGTI
jgi:5-methylcytosine-specific restriction endonuclease McrA